MKTMIKAENLQICYKTGDFREIGLKEWVVRHLTQNYHVNRFMAVNGVSFEVHQGEMVGIIGANGAGKSTLLKVVAGIMAPTEGLISVNGRVSALLELASGFDANLTVKENTYLRGALLGYDKSFMDAKYDEIISFAELEDFQDRRFSQLSSGMQARLAFSIVSLVQPDILILDEVLSVGDGSFQEKSAKKMMEIINSGAATILVTHSLQQVRDLCDKALWLHHGKQMAFGDANEVCNQYESMMDITPGSVSGKAAASTHKDEEEKPVQQVLTLNEPVFFGDKYLIHTVDGQRAFLDPGDLALTLHMMENHVWKPHVREVIAASVTAGSTYIDVGANVGLHSMYAAGFVGESGRVIAIEPNPGVMKILKTNMEINGFHGWTTFVQKAVSNYAGTSDFFIYSDHHGFSGFTEKYAEFEADRTSVKVGVDTLRSIVPKGEKVDCLKIDVESYEYEVFLGAGDILDMENITVIFKWIPPSVILTHGEATLDKTLDLMREKKFRFYLARYMMPLLEISNCQNEEIKKMSGDIVCTRRNHLDHLCK